ncbi:MAG: cytochrome c biogenesis heme-transporting ATPase CcmA [Halieaceae bacterium]|nr:cytochrome c biogenesis heme-transporting ATPase CcmA [Halieaceae bacterium]MCP4465903.1 cytochrome c biogenesis heme-transporting ATPase CcmA [Halieaceae bacterium]
MTDSAVGESLAEVKDLGLARGGRVLFESLSFAIRAGELWQLEGGNGAGKTSLLRILAGLSRYGFDGLVSRAEVPLYVGHQAAVKGLFSARENLSWHVSGGCVFADEQIEQALQRVGLCGFEDTPSHALSAGQHRRVNLARLFLSEARLWLLDEPFTAIDAAGVSELQERIGGHVARGGAVVVTSHQPLHVDHTVHHLSLDGARIS